MEKHLCLGVWGSECSPSQPGPVDAEQGCRHGLWLPRGEAKQSGLAGLGVPLPFAPPVSREGGSTQSLQMSLSKARGALGSESPSPSQSVWEDTSQIQKGPREVVNEAGANKAGGAFGVVLGCCLARPLVPKGSAISRLLLWPFARCNVHQGSHMLSAACQERLQAQQRAQVSGPGARPPLTQVRSHQATALSHQVDDEAKGTQICLGCFCGAGSLTPDLSYLCASTGPLVSPSSSRMTPETITEVSPTILL